MGVKQRYSADEDSGTFGGTRPDIIVVMVDDMGYIPNDRLVERLPNISRRFIDNGLRLTGMYGETPWCCPGRAAFLSGQHTRNHGQFDLHPHRFDPSQTLATALQDVGYHTVHVGKYMNNTDELETRQVPGWDQMDMFDGGGDEVMYLDGEPMTIEGNKNRLVADRSVAAVQNAPADRPLFLLSTPTAPHDAPGGNLWSPYVESIHDASPRCDGISPFNPPSYDWPDKPNGWPLREICESLQTVDDMVGELKEVVKARGREAVWVFMSDNGMAWGQHGRPLKTVPWSTQLPFYIAGYGVTPGTNDALFSNMDIGPTLAAMAGTSMPWADGEPIDLDVGRPYVYEEWTGSGGTGNMGKWWAIRTSEWRLIVKPGDWTRLYNLIADPWELIPVTNPAKRAELLALDPFPQAHP